jgi:hypothetical protein
LKPFGFDKGPNHSSNSSYYSKKFGETKIERQMMKGRLGQPERQALNKHKTKAVALTI